MIYLTPLVFNQIQLTATEIGSGFATAAVAGTVSRFSTGVLLDRGTNEGVIIKWASVLAIIGDLWLFNAQFLSLYLVGQIFLGAAAGLYWPSVELAVPSSCDTFPSSKGFALVRSADALGTSLGVLIGSITAFLGAIKFIYFIDIGCMSILLFFLSKKLLKDKSYKLINNFVKVQKSNSNIHLTRKRSWIKNLVPILCLSLLATGIFSLLQSALPLDLVIGGLKRPPLSEGNSGAILTIQLLLLVILQWPIGRWLSTHSLRFGLGLSILNFGMGSLLLGISALWDDGVLLALLAQVPFAIAVASFLPTATEAVIQTTPIYKRGFAMALFSQCFAISAFIAPTLSGRVIDEQGNAMQIWIATSTICLLMLPITKLVKANKY